MIDKKEIKESAVEYYKEYVEGEPLTQDVPIMCYVDGAKFILKKNKKNYKKALKTLQSFSHGLSNNEWLTLVNCLRMCAGMELIEIK